MTTSLNHLALIMDGNRRWAKERGLPTFMGHRAGYDRLLEIGEACLDRGISNLTVFAFSTENWKRSAEEVEFLMNLFDQALEKDFKRFLDKGARIRVLGRREGLRESTRRAIESMERDSSANSAATFGLCLNYGGRAEIVDACRRAIADGLKPEDVTEAEINKRLYWPDMPEPDLVVRTSGEERLSGFLAWESVYSELYFCEKHWPDFDVAELDKALTIFQERERRRGK